MVALRSEIIQSQPQESLPTRRRSKESEPESLSYSVRRRVLIRLTLLHSPFLKHHAPGARTTPCHPGNPVQNPSGDKTYLNHDAYACPAPCSPKEGCDERNESTHGSARGDSPRECRPARLAQWNWWRRKQHRWKGEGGLPARPFRHPAEKILQPIARQRPSFLML